MNKYKLRADCEADVILLQALLGGYAWEWVVRDLNWGLADVEATFSSIFYLEDIRDFVREITDGHVMLQTVAYATDYTGERDYDIY